MSADATYRFTFNALADVLEHGNIINGYCYSREECERTLSAIEGVVKKMKELIEKMEN